jgi:hypothetical protein
MGSNWMGSTAAAAVTAAVLSPRARDVVRKGAVRGLAGVLMAGDALSSFARGVGRGLQEANPAAAPTRSTAAPPDASAVEAAQQAAMAAQEAARAAQEAAEAARAAQEAAAKPEKTSTKTRRKKAATQENTEDES